jgi:hypothetical protein
VSNGFSGHGSVQAVLGEADRDTKGKLVVTGCWSTSHNWVELVFWPDDDDNQDRKVNLYVDSDNDEAVELAAILADAAGETEMAATLRAKSTKLAEREDIRIRAADTARAGTEAAKAAFLDAVTEQRTAFAAAVEQIEQDYQEVTGEVLRQSRSVDLATHTN